MKIKLFSRQKIKLQVVNRFFILPKPVQNRVYTYIFSLLTEQAACSNKLISTHKYLDSEAFKYNLIRIETWFQLTFRNYYAINWIDSYRSKDCQFLR